MRNRLDRTTDTRARRTTISLIGVVAAIVVTGMMATGCIPSDSVLKGRVTSTTGPEAGVPVAVYADDTDALVAQTVTDAQGNYGFASDALPNGTYRIRFSSSDWWLGASEWSAATPVPVTSDSPTRLNVSLTPETGSVAGTVTDSTGPAGGVAVSAINVPTQTSVATTHTAEDGTYSFAQLPAATYVFRFTSVDHAVLYNDSALTAAAAPLVPVTGDSHITDIDTTFTAPATITGQVVASATPLSGMLVIVFDKATGQGINFAQTGTDGTFTVGGLNNSGSYTVAIIDPTQTYAPRVVGSAEIDPTSGTAFIPTEGSADLGVVDMDIPANCAVPARPGVDWSGCDLTGRTLTGIDLTGANLSGANLTGVNLTDANLTGATLTGANLTSANLTGATLTSVRSGSTTGTPTLPTNWTVAVGYLVGPGADLDGAVLTYGDPHFSSVLELHGVNLAGASLVGANLSDGTQLWNANLSGANLTGANLYASDIRNSDLTGATLTDVNFDGPNPTITGTVLLYDTLTGITSGGITGKPYLISMSDGTSWDVGGGYLVGPGVDLSGLDLRGLDFSHTNLNGVNLAGANLSGLDLTGVNFAGANLTNTQLSGTTLTGVASGSIIGTPIGLPTGWKLSGGYLGGPGVDLSGLDLAGLDFSNVDFTGANLSASNLSGVNLAGTQLGSATLVGVSSGGITGTPASLPPRMALVNGYLVGTGVDLSGVNFDGADLTGVNLSGSNLSGASFNDAKLTGVDLSGANLTGASLVGTTLGSTDFTDTTLTGLVSNGIVGTAIDLPAGWALTSGFLVGPGADLSGLTITGADFTGVNFTNVNLTNSLLQNVNLTGADLSGATLTGIVSSGIIGTPSGLPTGFTVVSGFLVGPGANLAGKDLRGLDTTNLSLAGVNLTNANLSGLDLRHVSLAGTTLTGVNFHGANLDGAVLTMGDPHFSAVLSLQGVDLSDASLVGANLSDGTQLWNANLTGANLTGANLYGADIRNSNLTNATLTNVNFDGPNANIIGAVLLYNTLTGITSGGITGQPYLISMSDGTTWAVVNGYLIQTS